MARAYFGTILVLLLSLPALSGPYLSSGISDSIGTNMLSDEAGLSIILMIGDGMGLEQVHLGRLVETGDTNPLAMETLMWNASVTTCAADEVITDSAAAATAIATGHKTNYTFVGVDTQGMPLKTILEIAQDLNKSTGVVTTTSIQHATPASFMTHVDSRYNNTEIVRQIVEEANVDVVLGGGGVGFSSADRSTLQSNGYTMVYNRTQLLQAGLGKLFGIFDTGYLDYEQVRDFDETPSLKDMTNKSLEILSQNPDGFFLMVEGGRIDHACHANNRVNSALETIAFDEAVGVALDYVMEHDNTILIVTADHETGGLSIVSNTLNDVLPSELNTEEENRTLRIQRALNVTVEWSTEGHTSTPVPIYCYGSDFGALPQDMLIDNTETFHIMNDFYSGNPIMPATTTTSATTTTTILPTTDPTSTTTETPLPTITPPPDLLAPAIFGASLLVVVIIVTVYMKRR